MDKASDGEKHNISIYIDIYLDQWSKIGYMCYTVKHSTHFLVRIPMADMSHAC